MYTMYALYSFDALYAMYAVYTVYALRAFYAMYAEYAVHCVYGEYQLHAECAKHTAYAVPTVRRLHWRGVCYSAVCFTKAIWMFDRATVRRLHRRPSLCNEIIVVCFSAV